MERPEEMEWLSRHRGKLVLEQVGSMVDTPIMVGENVRREE